MLLKYIVSHIAGLISGSTLCTCRCLTRVYRLYGITFISQHNRLQPAAGLLFLNRKKHQAKYENRVSTWYTTFFSIQVYILHLGEKVTLKCNDYGYRSPKFLFHLREELLPLKIYFLPLPNLSWKRNIPLKLKHVELWHIRRFQRTLSESYAQIHSSFLISQLTHCHSQFKYSIKCLPQEIKLPIYYLFRYQLILIPLYIYMNNSTRSWGRAQTHPIAFWNQKWGKERQSHSANILIIRKWRQTIDPLCFPHEDWVYSQIWNSILCSKKYLRPDFSVKKCREYY